MKAEKSYFDKVHTWGRVSCVTSLVFMMGVPLAITLHLDAWPPLSGLLKGLAGVLPMFWTVAVIEALSYGPIIGSGGAYLAFVTGNISNLKLPCAIAALKGTGARANTEEGEVISTIAVASSAIATTVIIALGVLLFSPILPLLTAEGSLAATAFQQVLPALFGALLAGYLGKHWRVAVTPVLAGVLVLVFAPGLQVGVLIPILVILSLAAAQVMWKIEGERNRSNGK
ncbi:MAG: hypothetical protein LBG83_09525 [Oscillospiraceae bacterium]|jgi:hypothetical protein|nr:hypothetical protein [Oscillospiraceae bacterium]